MRRLLFACAIAVLSLAGLAGAWKIAPAFAAAGQDAAGQPAGASSATAIASGTGPIGAATKAIVVASGVPVRALTVDSNAQVYLTSASSPNRVFELGSPAAGTTPQLNPIAGSGQTGSLGDAGTAGLAQFDLKTDSLVMRSGVAAAPDGTIFIADTLNSTIRRISGSGSSEPGIVSSIAGRWAGSEGIPLSEPMGLALDRAGNLYIADYAAGAVDILPAATSATPGALEILAHVASPATIAVTADGKSVFVASPDAGRVISIDTATRALRSVVGMTIGSAAPGAGVAPADANPCNTSEPVGGMDCAAGLAVDGMGNLFVARLNAGEIIRVDAKTGASRVAAAGLEAPGDMSFDSKGNLYLSEQGHQRILEIKGLGAPVSNLTITAPAALPPPTPPLVCTALVAQPQAFNFCDMPVDGVTGAQLYRDEQYGQRRGGPDDRDESGVDTRGFHDSGNHLHSHAECRSELHRQPAIHAAANRRD